MGMNHNRVRDGLAFYSGRIVGRAGRADWPMLSERRSNGAIKIKFSEFDKLFEVFYGCARVRY